jgi:hypothetical protein
MNICFCANLIDSNVSLLRQIDEASKEILSLSREKIKGESADEDQISLSLDAKVENPRSICPPPEHFDGVFLSYFVSFASLNSHLLSAVI